MTSGITVACVGSPTEPLSYWDYLQLDQLLSAEEPRSEPAAHDELLFIVVHQAASRPAL